MIFEAVRRRGGLSPAGRVLDIGAYDPTIFSNSRGLIAHGWGGVLVEPVPWHAARLRQFYATRDDVEILQAAVGPDAGVGRMHVTQDMTSTLSAGWRARRAASGDLTRYEAEPMLVPLVTPDALLRAAGPFDVALIDAEGMSDSIALDLIAAARRKSCAPWLVVVEPDDPGALTAGMIASGYRLLATTENNRIFEQR